MKKITNFAIDYDDNTKKQFETCLNKEFVLSASLMPDAHSGYVAPIGSVLITKNFIVPSWVGYDIGCGMIAVKLTSQNLLEKIKENSQDIFKIINRLVPMGKGIYNKEHNITEKTKNEFTKLISKFKEKENYNKDDYNNISSKFSLSNLGSLGSGNHFIELGKFEKNEIFLVVHSGSRKIGHRLATKYMKLAKKVNKGEGQFEDTYPFKISSKEGQDYIEALNFGLDYALLNRLEMAYKVHSALETFLNVEIEFELWINKNHNHAVFENENIIHRKGATPAKKDERGVIPGNMRDGSFLVKGKGNKDYLESSSHGAGRILSRRVARKEIKLEDFKESMKGIVGSIRDKTLDEAPSAYKNIFDVINAQKESVEVVAHLKPIINWKG